MKILLITTARWLSAARLAMALTDVGCEVEALCPDDHPMLQCSVIRRHQPFHPLAPLRCIESAIRKSEPEFIIPGDELAILYLHRIHARTKAAQASTGVRELIERSLGDPASYPLAHSCNKLMAVAAEEGVATPLTAEVSDPAQIPGLASRFGLPLILKADGTSGGQGVRVLAGTYGAEKIWQSLRAPIDIFRLLKRIVMDSDWNQVLPFLRRDTRVVNAQSFISGPEANTIVSCWKGEMLACICFEVVHVWYPHGPSSVVRVVDDPAMEESSRRMVKRLRISGFCGFDFIKDEQTGAPQMIEMNSRPTQLAHLQLGAGRDLVTAWVSAAAGADLRARPAVTDKELIAIFPHELHRDPSSPTLQEGYHDVPWSEPSLVLSCMKKPSRLFLWRPGQRRFNTRAGLEKS